MNSSINIQIGEAIRSYLESKGLTQRDVAEKLSITQGAVSAYYRGKPFGKNAAPKWAEAFGFRENWLRTGEGDMLTAPKSNRPIEAKQTPDNALVEYLQRKITELEGKIDKLNEEKINLLQENAVLKYENIMLAPRKGDAEDAGSSLSADAI